MNCRLLKARKPLFHKIYIDIFSKYVIINIAVLLCKSGGCIAGNKGVHGEWRIQTLQSARLPRG